MNLFPSPYLPSCVLLPMQHPAPNCLLVLQKAVWNPPTCLLSISYFTLHSNSQNVLITSFHALLRSSTNPLSPGLVKYSTKVCFQDKKTKKHKQKNPHKIRAWFLGTFRSKNQIPEQDSPQVKPGTPSLTVCFYFFNPHLRIFLLIFFRERY